MIDSVFIDTNILIYFVEKSSHYNAEATALIGRIVAADIDLVTSELTFAEAMVGPTRDGDQVAAEKYAAIRRSDLIQFVPFDHAAAVFFAQIRASQNVKPPDAIQLACCAASGCDLFITNDERLSRRGFPGISMVTSLRQSPI